MRPVRFLLLTVFLFGGCAAEVAPSEELASDEAAVSGKADLIEVAGELVTTLPVLGNPQLLFHPAPGLAAVQPTASLKFSYGSCSTRRFNVKRELVSTPAGDRVLLQVEDANPVDCFGPPFDRTYDLPITTDAFAERNFTLLNPSQMTLSRVRECPAVACALFCEDGFLAGDDGCPVCRCAE